ncbi:MAG TPA: hypothetical protein VJ843_02885 [Candidatus Saccharimonadales bacterium]|nr:hypothetical protein [Candidatus Saccharimonadales bacterium]
MTERFESHQNDPRMSPHQLLLTALGKYLAPQNPLVRVVWDERPALLIGGDARTRTSDDTVKKYGVSLSCDAWAWQDAEPNPRTMYDVHLIGRTAAEVVTRFAVCSDAMYTAEPGGPLTTDKLQNPLSEQVVSTWVHFLTNVRFSEQSTDGVYDRMSAWNVMNIAGADDVARIDEGIYPYMELFSQETGGQE